MKAFVNIKFLSLSDTLGDFAVHMSNFEKKSVNNLKLVPG